MRRLCVIFFLAVAGCLMFAKAKGGLDDPSNELRNVDAFEPSPFFFTTKSYQKEALRLLLEDVNRVARDLRLSESLPITRSNLDEVIIQPPAARALGSVSTSNYVYCVCIDNKFTGLDRKHLDTVREQNKKDYLWPISRVDTNAAFQMATQIMAVVGLEMNSITRDCTVDIRFVLPEGKHGVSFVPEYWVTWAKTNKTIAFLRFLLPTRDIYSLGIRDTSYSLRKSIEVPNLGELLREGNPPQILLQKLGLEPTNSNLQTNSPLH